MMPLRGLKMSVAMGVLLCAAGVQGQQKKEPHHSAPRPPSHHAPAEHHAPVHHAAPTSHTMKSGSSVTRTANGHVADVHDASRGMDIHHGLSGERTVSVTRLDHSRVVTFRGRPGYIERGYAFHGHDYYRRSYFWHGHAYNGFYRGYFWHGVGLHVYAPYRFYPLGFYGWAYRPWGFHVVYGWGWGPRPWYGYYGYYFAPYPYYLGASYWLTDYMLSNDLQAAYDAGHADGVAAAGGDAPDTAPAPLPVVGSDAAATNGPELSPEVKDLIAQEVEADIQVENGEAALNAVGQEGDPETGSLAGLLADGKSHVFVVGAPVDVENELSGDECSLSEGDVIQETIPPGPDDKTASLVVLASKTGGKECGKTATVTVKLEDLQDMQNHMRESVDRGMEELQKKQGTEGLPAAPASATAAPVEAAFTQAAPPPEQDEAAVLSAQQKDASVAEKEVTAQEAADTGAPATQSTPAPIVREPPASQPQ
jgi:hypothetical protein